ncbi:hypothetical protein CRUP_021597 [Coryphaenoides rupestris]|nr:hypothetical protein CRUP_021597 [Coryphaenoides rupestris]
MAVLLPNCPSFSMGYPSVYSPAAPALLPQAPFTFGGFAPAAPLPQYPTLPAPLQPPPPLLQPPAVPVLRSPKADSSCEEEEDEEEAEEAAGPPALFSSSRSSSPLQLNLLQEELPKPSENQDSRSTSSELLDVLLQQDDARSGTGSNASGSGSGESGGSLGSGSSSNGTTSTSHAGCSSSSSNSSKYFASNDSSDTSRKARQEPGGGAGAPARLRDAGGKFPVEHDPAHAQARHDDIPDPHQDQQEVLAEDMEKLRVMQPLQPWFTQEQREELAKVMLVDTPSPSRGEG